MTGFLDTFIQSRVRALMPGVIRKRLPAIADKIADDVYRQLWQESARFRFIKRGQWALKDADPTLSDERSFIMARDVLNQFLADEKIEFGDAQYDWGKDAPAELMRAYEIEYWDARP